jgi:hypothetical protein
MSAMSDESLETRMFTCLVKWGVWSASVEQLVRVLLIRPDFVAGSYCTTIPVDKLF